MDLIEVVNIILCLSITGTLITNVVEMTVEEEEMRKSRPGDVIDLRRRTPGEAETRRIRLHRGRSLRRREAGELAKRFETTVGRNQSVYTLFCVYI